MVGAIGAPHVRRYRVAPAMEVAADVGGDPSRPSVVLLHGGGQTRHSWAGAARCFLERGWHVVNLDARGHGDSDWAPDADYSLPALVADLLAVVRTLPSPPALVGASLGGATALCAAGSQPRGWARALVLVDIVPKHETGAAKVGAFMRSHLDGFASLEEAADAVANFNPHRPRPRDPAGLMKNLRRGTDGRLRWHWDPRFVDHPRALDAQTVERAMLDAAARIRTPTLLVRGMESDVVSQAGVEELRALIPTLSVAEVAKAGHMVVGDRNDQFNRAVGEFLDVHSANGDE